MFSVETDCYLEGTLWEETLWGKSRLLKKKEKDEEILCHSFSHHERLDTDPDMVMDLH